MSIRDNILVFLEDQQEPSSYSAVFRASFEGKADNTVVGELGDLVGDGLVAKIRVPGKRMNYYKLTPKGRDEIWK